MASRYAQWMYDWEHRLTSVDNNRVVRPLDWGLGFARDWPCRNGWQPAQAAGDPAKCLVDFNRRIVASSDEFFSYKTPTDFRLEKREVQVFSTREVPDPKLEAKVKGTHAEFLRFTAPVKTPYPENNLVNARWFPARGRRATPALVRIQSFQCRQCAQSCSLAQPQNVFLACGHLHRASAPAFCPALPYRPVAHRTVSLASLVPRIPCNRVAP